MPKEEAKEAGAQTEKNTAFDLKKLKKPVYAITMFMSAIGIVTAIFLAFVINDALDKTESAISSNLDSAISLLSDMENVALDAESEIDSVNASLSEVGDSLGELAGGIEATGITIKGFGNTLSQINLPGFSLSQYGDQLGDSADELINGSANLKQAGELSGHKDALGQLKDSVASIRNDISQQRAQISGTKRSISDSFGLIKLANMLVFILVVLMFAVLLMNSAAGIF